jgi:aspartate aminotransferase
MSLRRSLASLSRAKTQRLVPHLNAASGNNTAASFWSHIPAAPADPILGITEDYNRDTNPQKVNLSVGAYRDDRGLPYVLPSIRMASAVLYQEESNKEYTSIIGSANYNSLVKHFLYGSFTTGAQLIEDDRIAIAQSLSGTGALKLAGEFLNRWSPHSARAVYLSNPTWSNHANIFANCGIEPRQYSYFNPETNSIDFTSLIGDLLKAEKGSAVLLHACCHNPTGLDPTEEQWKEIVDVLVKQELIPIVDIAYQGFQSGHLSQDLYLLQLISEKCQRGQLPTAFICQSFAKNMGLYGERVGSISVITPSKEIKEIVDSQMKVLIRSIYSSPSIHGSKLVEIVLSQDGIYAQWNKDVLMMADRIKSMRSSLHSLLTSQSSLNWEHLVQQNGMFCYTGLSREQMIRLQKEFSIYATLNGRFSIAGLNTANVEYVARAMDEVTK